MDIVKSFQILETWCCAPKRTTVVLQASIAVHFLRDEIDTLFAENCVFPSAKPKKNQKVALNAANHVILSFMRDPSKKSFLNVFSSKPLWNIFKKREHAFLVEETACVM